MVNDLAFSSKHGRIRPSQHWKYVDDMTIAELVPYGSSSLLQSDLDAISCWARENNMKLNPKRCKEVTISFLHKDPSITPLYTDDILVEPAQTHKILGLQLRI